MFDVAWAKLLNFRSFRGEHTIKLPTAPGLYLITGKNEAEPRLSGNGVGKSSLFDAIYWCLYGHTTRGLKAGDIITWDEKTCSVTVTLKVADEELQIKRVQSPNSLTLNNRPVSQEALEKHIRLGPEAFTYAVLMPQFGDSFFDLRPEPKLKIFTEIMELDFWLDKAKQADELANELLALKSKSESDAIVANSQIKVYKADIGELVTKDSDFVNGKEEAIQSIKAKLAQVKRAKAKGLEAIKFAEKALKNIASKQVGLVGKLCPTCKQPIPNKDSESLDLNQRDWERKLIDLQRTQSRHDAEHSSWEWQLKREQDRINPYAEEIAQKQAKIKAAKKRLTIVEAEINALDEDHAAVAYWSTGFKRIRLFVVEETLRKLEVEVNNCVSSLGLTDWRVEFDIERENKSGGVTKGFAVMVYPPNRKEPIRFESYAGGETQRLRLAGNLGLANLIMERAGLITQVEFYDEISQHLSAEGIDDALTTLSERASSLNRRILVIDHHTLDFGDFAGVFIMTKTSNGSSVRYEGQ
jgi:DNA repair exonuclease SbcCD ATPase subunit